MDDIRCAAPKSKVLNRDRARFEVAGGDYRLVVAFDFRRQIAFVKFIGKHARYDNIDALTVSQYLRGLQWLSGPFLPPRITAQRSPQSTPAGVRRRAARRATSSMCSLRWSRATRRGDGRSTAMNAPTRSTCSTMRSKSWGTHRASLPSSWARARVPPKFL